jgi:hypothetical protein
MTDYFFLRNRPKKPSIIDWKTDFLPVVLLAWLIVDAGLGAGLGSAF